ncbi:MAG: GT4 family glycosyltransferase PelF [Firmicutes bacterium]|nr:GT4 family glycosyltransferase PelF [Bacillota bacterium]
MKICLIAEGCYPYLVGGVSSWIQSLITSLPEYRFVIYAIGANQESRGDFKYKLPSNVVEVKEVFLDAVLEEDGKWGKRYKLRKSENDAIESLLEGRETDWQYVFDFFLRDSRKNAADFLTSKNFLDMVKKTYHHKYSKLSFTDFFWTMRSIYLPLFYLIKQGIEEADLYHSVSTGYAGIVGSLGSYLYDKPYVVTEHGIYTREREEEIIQADWVKGYFKDIWIEYFYSLSRCAYHYADEVITLFSTNKEIQVELGCSADKIRIVPNGVKVEGFTEIAQKDEADEHINIGAVVRIVPIKDIKSMLQSFDLVKKQVPNTRLYIMGPTDENEEYYEECKLLLKILGTEDVIFTGRVDIKEYIGKMDVLVLSSISEGQPFAILEGMACGKPFVATNVGSCKELIYGENDDYGKAGIIVPLMNDEKMGNAIVKLCRSEALRAEMGQAALRRVKELYAKDDFIATYRDLYHSYEGV